MTLLSLFIANVGIFCFIPISERLVESGILTTYLLAPIFYIREEDQRRNASLVLAEMSAWKQSKGRYTLQFSSPDIPFHYSPGEFLEEDGHQFCLASTHICPACGADLVSRLPTDSSIISSPLAPCPTWESSCTTLPCDDARSCSCNCNLNDAFSGLALPDSFPDHLLSVVRAITLLQGQDQHPDTGIDDPEIVSLTKAFSMLRL